MPKPKHAWKAQVIDLRHYLAKKDRTLAGDDWPCCRDCGFSSADDSVWLIGLDTPATRADPQGQIDSGRYVCPHCKGFVDATIFDTYAEIENHSIRVNLPFGVLFDALDNLDLDDVVTLQGTKPVKTFTPRFNVGSAIINAVRRQLFDAFPKLAEQVFGESRDTVVTQLKYFQKPKSKPKRRKRSPKRRTPRKR